MTEPNWGPTGKVVFERTYQRPKPDGSRETWDETVTRVVTGNLSLVYGPREDWSADVDAEFDSLYDYMAAFKILPAGRHLWASGVPGRQYLFNCHVSGWGKTFSDHFEFTFMRLMEGGGVGANYSSRFLEPYGAPRRALNVHIVCDPTHPDYEKMRAAELLSEGYSHEWSGAFPVEDSREGWAIALTDLLDTYMTDRDVKHVDRVYDVSRVRKEGSPLRTFGGTASGPLPFARMMVNVAEILNVAPGADALLSTDHITPLEAMEIDHEIGQCVVAGGNRRSARMSMVRWDDPYIFDFINCKSDPGKHWTTNISVEIDDEFISGISDVSRSGIGVENADTFSPEGRKEWARRVHRAVVTGMLTNGEPGYWNSTLSNIGEPNEVVCTNPCGEIALREWENCNLGHVNLDAFSPAIKGADYDRCGLIEAHRLMTRFLIRATYGDVNDGKQAEMLAAQRRIGVGHFGVQGFLVKNGIKFSEAPDNRAVIELLHDMKRTVREEARKYAFTLRIPEPVKVTTVAPTGSIAKLAGRTEGIHPVYAKRFIRRVRFSEVDPGQWNTVLGFVAQGFHAEPCQYAANTWVVEFPTEESLVGELEALGIDADSVLESADEIALEDMLAFQAMYQKMYADNAISFTVNVPEGRYTVNGVMEQLSYWLPYLKGTTLMIDGSRPQAPYERLTLKQWDALEGPKTVADSVDENCATGACPVR